MVDISFISITNQEYKPWASRVFQSVRDALKSYPIKYSYEFILCSPEEPQVPEKDVIWVKDEINKPGNAVYALNKAFHFSSGKYIFTLNDDHTMPDYKPLKAVEFLRSDLFKDRRFKVTSIGASWNCNIYGSTTIPNLHFPPPLPLQLSIELQKQKYLVRPNRYLILGYPVFDRKTVVNELKGFLFNPSFKSHYADNFLPFFLGESGEEP